MSYPSLLTKLLRWMPAWALVLASVLPAPAMAFDKENRGYGLDRMFGISGAFGFGTRNGFSGKTGLLRMEGAGYFMTTPMGNRGGLEGYMDLGYDGLDGYNTNNIGFLWDMALGFPVTLYEKFDEDSGAPLLSTALAPGLGISNEHAYVYIKGKVAARIVPKVTAEVSYQWTPYNGSLTWEQGVGKHAGFAMAFLRFTTYFAVSDDISLLAYFDWRQSNLDDPQPGSDPALQAFDTGMYASGSFSPIHRTRWDNNYRIGLGVAF